MDREEPIQGKLQMKNHVLIGADVVGLYPSLDAELSAEAVREETVRSEIKFKGINNKEALRYIAVNCDKFEARRLGLEHLVPVRRFKKGQKPTIRGADAKSKNDTTDDKWIFMEAAGRDLSEHEQRLIVGGVLKVAVKTCFNKHTYKYGNEIFRQVGGGPTGFQATGRVSKIRMIKVLRKLKRILRNSGIDWKTMFLYVDDFRLLMRALKRGSGTAESARSCTSAWNSSGQTGSQVCQMRRGLQKSSWRSSTHWNQTCSSQQR